MEEFEKQYDTVMSDVAFSADSSSAKLGNNTVHNNNDNVTYQYYHITTPSHNNTTTHTLSVGLTTLLKYLYILLLLNMALIFYISFCLSMN